MNKEQIIELLQKHSDFKGVDNLIAVSSNNFEKVAEEILSLSRKKEKKIYLAPSKQEVLDFFRENNYQIMVGERCYNHYQSGINDRGEWTDINGKIVKDWKRKIRTNWFREENKIKVLQTTQNGMVR